MTLPVDIGNLDDLVAKAEEACPEEWGEFRLTVEEDGGVWGPVKRQVLRVSFNTATGNLTFHLGDELP